MTRLDHLSLKKGVSFRPLDFKPNQSQSLQESSLKKAIDRARQELLARKQNQQQYQILEPRRDHHLFDFERAFPTICGIDLSLLTLEEKARFIALKEKEERKKIEKKLKGEDSRGSLVFRKTVAIPSFEEIAMAHLLQEAKSLLPEGVKKPQYKNCYDKVAAIFLRIGIALVVAAPFSFFALPVLVGLSVICFLLAFVLPMIGRILSVERSR